MFTKSTSSDPLYKDTISKHQYFFSKAPGRVPPSLLQQRHAQSSQQEMWEVIRLHPHEVEETN